MSTAPQTLALPAVERLTVAGVDPSLSGTGLARLDGGRTVATRRLPTGPGDGSKLARIRMISEAVADWCRPASLVVIEGLSYGSHGSATRDLAGLWWRLVDVIESTTGTPAAVVAPGQLKKWATGHGRGSKVEVRDHIAHRWSLVRRLSYDEADALVLASMGLHSLDELPWTATDAQRDTIRRAFRDEEVAR